MFIILINVLLLLYIVTFYISEKVDAIGFLGKSSVDDLDPYYEHVIKMVAPKMGLELFDFIYGENLTDSSIEEYIKEVRGSELNIATFTSITDSVTLGKVLDDYGITTITTYSPIVYLEEGDAISSSSDARNVNNLAFIKHKIENTEFDTFCSTHTSVPSRDCVYIAKNVDLLIKSLEISGSLDIITLVHHLYDINHHYGDEEIMLVDNNYISTSVYIYDFKSDGSIQNIVYEVKATYNFEPEGNYGEMRYDTCDFLLFLEEGYAEYDGWLPIAFIQIMNSFEDRILRDFFVYLINTLNDENV